MTNTNDYRINWKKLSITQEGEGTVIHPLIALALTPIMGLAFLMFLPFVGFYLSIAALGKKVYSVVHVFNRIPAPEVGLANLTGPNAVQNNTNDNTDLEEIEKEIASRKSK